MQLIKLAWRNFSRHLNRYRVLLLALTVVVAVLIMVLGAVTGMQETLRDKASRYFAGNVVVFGYMDGDESLIEDPELIDSLLDRAGVTELARSRRSTYYSPADTNLFHAGYYMPQRRYVGVEWERERPVLDRFDFASGGVPDEGDERGVLISTATAEELRASVGDEIIVSSSTDQGVANTVPVVVRGIFRESSFFGYSTYLERRTLNRLLDRPEDQVNEIGMYFDGAGGNETRVAEAVNAALDEELPTFPVIRTREENSAQRSAGRDERHYGSITLSAQLAEINDILEAMTLIAAGIIALFLLLVVIGVSNTFSMVIFERTREIGTLRAMGMTRPRTVILFLLEALFLGAAGVVLGSLLGTGVLEFVSRSVGFARAPGFAELFLQAGQLHWSLTLGNFAVVAAMAILAGVAGSLRAALRAARVSPVTALRHET